MNWSQVHALDRMMSFADPLPIDVSDPRPELLVSLEVADGKDDGFARGPWGGSTMSARLWTVEGHLRFPDLFFIRSDGLVYVYDEDADQAFKVEGWRWLPPSRRVNPDWPNDMIGEWRWTLEAQRGERVEMTREKQQT